MSTSKLSCCCHGQRRRRLRKKLWGHTIVVTFLVTFMGPLFRVPGVGTCLVYIHWSSPKRILGPPHPNCDSIVDRTQTPERTRSGRMISSLLHKTSGRPLSPHVRESHRSPRKGVSSVILTGTVRIGRPRLVPQLPRGSGPHEGCQGEGRGRVVVPGTLCRSYTVFAE